MYSEDDINRAVATGALSAQAAAALRASAGREAAPAVDEESFRLLTGFNDIFVSIATILLLVAVGWIGGAIGQALLPPPVPQPGVGGDWMSATVRSWATTSLFGSAGVAAASWLLAEYFTRVRRMALPSILLLATFALGVGGIVMALGQMVAPIATPRSSSLTAGLAGAAVAGALLLHWRRFRVPVTIAVLTLALALTVLGLLLAAIPALGDAVLPLVLIAGLAIFAYAMHWDMADPTRTTRRSDVAFWLHLAAAPMIAHPIFHILGVTDGASGAGMAVIVILLYVAFGLVALAVDRRALLVSSLFYVLYALSSILSRVGALSLSLALTALVIGSALLTLSAFWHDLRRRVVSRLPAGLQARLPVVDRPAIPRPA